MKDTYFLKNFLIGQAAKSLTGKKSDLENLLSLSESKKELPLSVQWFLKDLSGSIKKDGLLSNIFLRVGKELSLPYKKKLIRNLIINQFIEGEGRRNTFRNSESWVPNFVVISPTMKCNYHCTGCYSGLYTKRDELSEKELDDILRQCRDLGIYFIVISGGEPYIMKDVLFRLFKKYNDMFFLTYTNGSLLDKAAARKLAKLGNVAPAISFEGWEKETDERRGKGAWDRALSAMEHLRNAGVLFGNSITYTRNNIDVITDEKFIEFFLGKGAIFSWYFMFMPVGKDPILDLVPTPEQRVITGKRLALLRNKYPLFIADFWNDGPAAGGCLAGGRQYLHILNTGQVEPCVFAHFNSDNIREKSLLDCSNSPFFKDIRASFPYNQTGNLKRPCMIIDNPQVLRDAVDRHVIPSGHAHSEDLIHSGEVKDFIDDYARRMKELTEEEWQEIMADPSQRWYREGKDYRELFKFQKAEEKVPAGQRG